MGFIERLLFAELPAIDKPYVPAFDKAFSVSSKLSGSGNKAANGALCGHSAVKFSHNGHADFEGSPVLTLNQIFLCALFQYKCPVHSTRTLTLCALTNYSRRHGMICECRIKELVACLNCKLPTKLKACVKALCLYFNGVFNFNSASYTVNWSFFKV